MCKSYLGPRVDENPTNLDLLILVYGILLHLKDDAHVLVLGLMRTRQTCTWPRHELVYSHIKFYQRDGIALLVFDGIAQLVNILQIAYYHPLFFLVSTVLFIDGWMLWFPLNLSFQSSIRENVLLQASNVGPTFFFF